VVLVQHFNFENNLALPGFVVKRSDYCKNLYRLTKCYADSKKRGTLKAIQKGL
jgi:hypothetical protein